MDIHVISVSHLNGSIHLWLTPTMKVKTCGRWEGWGKNRGAVNSFSDKGQGKYEQAGNNDGEFKSTEGGIMSSLLHSVFFLR